MPTHGKATSVVLGAFDLTPWLNSITVTDTTEVAETSVFQEDDKTYVVGMGDAKVSFGGRFEAKPGAIKDIIRTQIVNQVDYEALVGYGRGIVHGQTATFGDVLNTSFGVTAAMSDVSGVSGEAQVNGGWHDGVQLLDGSTAISAGLTGPTVQMPVYGQPWAAAVFVIGSTVTGGITVQLQNSPDGATWSALGAPFAFGASTSGSQRLSGAAGVGDYVRALVTFSGTGSARVLAAYGRF